MPASNTIPALPDFMLVPASAGAGKTYALTQRYLRLIMTDGLPHNDLRNILAVTFTKNAAKEMKERILETLKRAALGDEETLGELRQIVLVDDEELRSLAMMYVEKILDQYSDFQVQTIDSFITRVLKASAVELGLPPQFEVDFNTDAILDEVLDLFARELAANSSKQELLVKLVDLLSEQRTAKERYLWNPLDKIARELRILYKQLSSHTGEPKIEDAGKRPQSLAQEIRERLRQIGELGKSHGLVVSKRFQEIIDLAATNNLDTVLNRKLSQQVLNKPKGEYDEKAAAQIESLQNDIGQLVAEYYAIKSRTHDTPYLQAYTMMKHLIEQVQRRREAVFLGEANRSLAQMINLEIVPEIYFSLGEQVHHFLIDEFQDTSPIQWAVLRPLIEHSLGGRGSLFIVGDMKQSIYTFRGADWRIMRRMLERDEFPSTKTRLLPLTTNYRSAEAVVEFTKDVFHTRVPKRIPEGVSDLSGLVSYRQDVLAKAKGKGYVSVHVFEPPAKDEEPETQTIVQPERERLLRILGECRARGYRFGDIAILTPRNTDVVEVSRWLNAEGITFLSHSSLDIRTRRSTGELIALLKFLDSPVNNHALGTFLLGRLFSTAVGQEGITKGLHSFIHKTMNGGERNVSLYGAFREAYPELWEKYFKRLFELVGYLPLYDLAAEAYGSFDLFAKATDEEATLVKFLEVVKEFEDNGNNSLKDFLRYAEDDGEETSEGWDIETAESEDAVHVMTVHKAKGLGFPVLVTLFYDRVLRTQNRFIVGEGEHVQLLYVTRDWADKSPQVEEHYVQLQTLTQVDDLNKLYVALTRARDEMHVLCVKKRRGDQPSAFLPDDGYINGKPLEKPEQEARSDHEATVLHAPTNGLPVATVIEPLNLLQKNRGEFIHNVLSEVQFLDGSIEDKLETAIARWKHTLSTGLTVNDLSKTLMEFLALPEVAEYFTPKKGRVVLTEQDVVDEFGGLHRIDRLVIDDKTVTVLDYKTGDEKGEYSEQVGEYMELVTAIYPGRDIKGLLLYVDRKIVRGVT